MEVIFLKKRRDHYREEIRKREIAKIIQNKRVLNSSKQKSNLDSSISTVESYISGIYENSVNFYYYNSLYLL